MRTAREHPDYQRAQDDAARTKTSMKKKTEKRERRDELRGEYDLSELKGVRGKWERIWCCSHRMSLSIPDEQAVNSACGR